jgi:thiamine transporter ThiT
MNGISGLATALVTTIVLLVLYRMNPTIFVPKDTLR